MNYRFPLSISIRNSLSPGKLHRFLSTVVRNFDAVVSLKSLNPAAIPWTLLISVDFTVEMSVFIEMAGSCVARTRILSLVLLSRNRSMGQLIHVDDFPQIQRTCVASLQVVC